MTCIENTTVTLQTAGNEENQLTCPLAICDTFAEMKTYSTRQAAKKLGLHTGTLARYIAVGKLPAPTVVDVGTAKLHVWTEAEIENVRKLLPTIGNGRKTRYKRQSVETKTPPRAAAPHNQRKRKKK